MKPRIVIMGMGEIGTALARILGTRRHVIHGWDAVPGKVPHQKSLFEIVPHADFIFIAIPSWCVENAIKSIRPLVRPHTVIVSLTKGFIAATGETPVRFLARTFPKNNIAILGGAMLAEELMRGLPGFAVCASDKRSAREHVSALFKGTALHLTNSDDVDGVAVLGILKNVYALGIGIASSIGFGSNAVGAFTAASMREMVRLTVRLGGRARSAETAAGVADFIATGFSDYSKNRSAGKSIAAGGKKPPLSESIASLPVLVKALKGVSDGFPVINAIAHAVKSGARAKELMRALVP